MVFITILVITDLTFNFSYFYTYEFNSVFLKFSCLTSFLLYPILSILLLGIFYKVKHFIFFINNINNNFNIFYNFRNLFLLLKITK